MIEVKSLLVKAGQKEILSSLNLSIHKELWTCLVGPNGSGKTTFLKVLLGVQRYEGSVQDESVEIYKNNKRNVAFVPQQPQIPAGMTVTEYVLLGRARKDGWGAESRVSRALVSDTLKVMGLLPMRSQLVTQLSGGEMQRTLIARSLVQEPDLMLLDEPTSALDLHHQIEVLNNIELLKDRGVSIISTMHDITLAAMYADQIVIMKNGSVLLSGDAESVIHSPELKEAFDDRISVFTLDNGRPVIVAAKKEGK